MSAPAGWHRQDDGRERFWDGQQWTEQFRSPNPATTAMPVGQPQHGKKGGTFKPWMGYVGAALVSLVIGIAVGSSGDSNTTTTAAPAAEKVQPTATVTTKATITAGPTPTVIATSFATVTAPPPKPKTAISDGAWTVGTDVAAGTYKVIEAISGDCYWEIDRAGTNGQDIVANDNVSGGRPQVKLSKGQEFHSQDCGDWARVS